MVKFSTVIVFLFVSSCVREAVLSIQRTDNPSNKLKLNGYYYIRGQGQNEGLITAYFLYRNGVIRNVGSIRTSNLTDVDKNILDDFVNSKIDSKTSVGWGVYKIDANKISIEYWKGTMDWYSGTLALFGNIQNDSTFNVVQRKFSGDKKVNEINETYHFRQFRPKPDSTNNLIK